ncbi:hypothetical protein LJR029_006326 [Caballeronia sp. LjRoot29]|uniref:hypothetical protein n=1 Tax=Caballeronia sp. LjRoot29 TaxID=3342315 RepID=UPI003ED0E00D
MAMPIVKIFFTFYVLRAEGNDGPFQQAVLLVVIQRYCLESMRGGASTNIGAMLCWTGTTRGRRSAWRVEVGIFA